MKKQTEPVKRKDVPDKPRKCAAGVLLGGRQSRSFGALIGYSTSTRPALAPNDSHTIA